MELENGVGVETGCKCEIIEGILLRELVEGLRELVEGWTWTIGYGL